MLTTITEGTSGATPPTPPPVVPITAHHHLLIKLMQTNFTSWRPHLIALLRCHKFLRFIEVNAKAPALLGDDSNVAFVDYWYQQGQLLLAAIFGSLSADVLPLVSTA